MRRVDVGIQLGLGALGGLLLPAFDVTLPAGWWPRGSIVVVSVAVALAIGPLARLLEWPGFVPIALGGWLAANYGCVPETGQIQPVMWWLVAAGVVELVFGRQLPWGAHYGLAWMVMWTGVFGATGQGRALVGALFGSWAVVLLPLLTMLLPVTRYAPLLARWSIAAAGGVAALIVARTGALRPPLDGAVRSALQWGAASLVAAAVVGVSLGWWGRRRRRASS